MITEQDIEKIARAQKVRYLRTLPGMDAVAVALNAQPTYDEIELMRRFVKLVEEAGYEIVKKGQA